VVQTVLEKTGIDLFESGIPELFRFQVHFRDCKIVVYQGLSREDVMFEGQGECAKRLNLQYVDVERHYHVIAKRIAAMAKKYNCKACHKAFTREITHVCYQTFSDCMASSPCAFSDVRIPCDDCNRHFGIRTCFDKHKQSTSTKKSM